MAGPMRVLFLCTGNSARSIIAEALLRQIGGRAFDAHSGGIDPRGVNPLTLRALAEAGVPADELASKSADRFAGERFDYVITLCDDAAERCPVFPADARRLHWGLPDPASVDGGDDAKGAAFRRTVAALRERIEAFVAERVTATT